MQIGFSELGLLFIAAGWFIQAFTMTGKKNELQINKNFVLLYALGVLMLLVDGFMNVSKFTNLLNLLALLGALIVYFRFKK